MKKQIGLVLALLLAGINLTNASGVATKVKWYTFKVSLPDANRATNSFPVARDALMAGLKAGGVFDPRGRENLASGIDVKNYFDGGDVTTTTGPTTLWRGQFDPPEPFTNNFGNRGYVAVILEGIDGQVSISRISWKVSGGILSGARDLDGTDYFPSTRVGINAGPDARLWTADDAFVTVGSGTVLCDAVAYIGASLSSPNANSTNDFVGNINTYLAGGLPVTVEYRFEGGAGPLFHSETFMVYPLGGVPDSEYGLKPIFTSYGILWTLMGPQGSLWEIGGGVPIPSGPFGPVVRTPGFSIPAYFEQDWKQFYSVRRIQ